MKKFFYFAACLVASMSLCLTSCGDDDPVPEPTPTPTPTPEPEPTPSDTTKTNTTALYALDLYYPTTNLACEGDSVAYFALVESLIQAQQDSVEQAGGTLVITYDQANRTAYYYDKNTEKSTAQSVCNDLQRKLTNAGLTSQGFVYVGGIYRQDEIVTLSENFQPNKFAFSTSAGHMNGSVEFPNLTNSTWSTTAAEASVQSILFSSRVRGNAYLNGDEETAYSFRHSGNVITLTKDDAEAYAFQLNETGTVMVLIRENGAEVANGAAYTCPNFPEINFI